MERTIHSIENQKWRGFEHIVVEWCPPRGRLRVTCKNLTYHPYRKVHYRINDTGIYMAMNFGASMATGEYIIFLNAGDTLLDIHSLHALAQYIESSSHLDANYHCPFHYSKRNPQPQSYDILGFNNIELAIRSGALICQQALVFNRMLLCDLGGFNESYKLAGDYEFVCRTIDAGHAWISLPLAAIRYEDGGLSEKCQDEAIREIRDIRDIYTGRIFK